MKSLLLLLTVAGVAAAAMVKTGAGQMLTSTTNQPRGVRNNNPLNIEQGQNWQGEIETSDTRYEAFQSPEYGFRAAARILRNYKRFYGITTVREIISRWAPSTENDTNNYINFVGQELGVTENDNLNLNDDGVLARLMLAMSVMECGRGWFSLGQAKQGAKLEYE